MQNLLLLLLSLLSMPTKVVKEETQLPTSYIDTLLLRPSIMLDISHTLNKWLNLTR